MRKPVSLRDVARRLTKNDVSIASELISARSCSPAVKELRLSGPLLGVTSIALLASTLLSAAPRAAEAPAQAWPTSISGTGATVGSARTFNWGSSPYGSPGVTATQTITSRVAAPSAAGCLFMGGAGTGVGNQPNYVTFTEPDVPASASFASACIEGSNGFVSSFVFNKPLIGPIFHFHNLDASRFAITGTSTAGSQIGLTAVARNNLMDISGTTLNNTVQPATQAGCNNNSGSDPINGACGSFRVTAASGLIRTLTLNHNATPPTGTPTGFNDGMNWTVSFPTAPLTKQFSPSTINAGQISQRLACLHIVTCWSGASTLRRASSPAPT